MFNKKGQVTIGILILAFILIIVGTVLISPIASNVEGQRNTVEVQNTTITAAATVNTSVEFLGSGFVGTVTAQNATTAIQILAAGDFVARSRQAPITSGVVTNTFELTDDGVGWVGAQINLSYTSEPDGFLTDGGSRAIIALITIFLALTIGIIAFIPAARSGMLDMFRG